LNWPDLAWRALTWVQRGQHLAQCGQPRRGDTGFARHQLQGLNLPLLEMFSQFMQDSKAGQKNFPFNEVLGVRQNDFMLTVNADDHALMKRFHKPGEEKGMVVILDPKDYGEWLTCTPGEAKKFCRQWTGALDTAPRPDAA